LKTLRIRAGGNLHRGKARYKESFDKKVMPKNSEVREGDDVFLRVGVTEVGRNHKLESLVQGPYRVLENAGATFRLRIGAEDVRVSSDRVTPAPRRELSPLSEGNPTSSEPVPPAPVDGTPSSPPIYRSEGQPCRPGNRKVPFYLPTPSKEARRPSSTIGASMQGEFVVEKLVDFGEAADGARLYRVRWLGNEDNQDTWEHESGLPNAFIRRYWRTKGRATRP
jgi:hypothetical protein